MIPTPMAENSYSYYPSISADGQRIAFQTYATDLVTGVTDVNGPVWPYYGWDVYLRDLSGGTPTTVLVSHTAADATTTGDNGSSHHRSAATAQRSSS